MRRNYILVVGFHDDFGDLYMDVFYFVNFIDVFFVAVLSQEECRNIAYYDP